ncbi:Peptidase S9B dipeptidylpeptidase IV N-terminal [Penicillium alfredii]|uniref:dipeptidyl-peptidase IV n=1 Tax=Penicillium alfredii TaxID=1506179 RepID=A0A9W9GAG3_9EURO|nr:Peptidase S9B dipeptidylpeptidase IV N-terminal [Penicillium alfredii]KAJ5114873.1 Peptidase S9B dipeptidylpeptidase IV N-terminal [Penicillium alfredii]
MEKIDGDGPESVPLNRPRSASLASQDSSDSSLSITPASFPNSHKARPLTSRTEGDGERYRDIEDGGDAEYDTRAPPGFKKAAPKDRMRRFLWGLGILCVSGWVLAFILFLAQKRPTAAPQTFSDSTPEIHDPGSWGANASGQPVTLEQVLTGKWLPTSHAISWIAGPNGEDGLLVERGGGEGAYLRVEDIRNRKNESGGSESRVLMEEPSVRVDGKDVTPSKTWPSLDLQKVLILSDKQSNWRYSFFGNYWIFDVESQTAEPLDPGNQEGRVQLAKWSPKSDAVVFVRDKNLFLRKLGSSDVIHITKDGGKDLFYGVPDWVYEEEVFSDNTGTWWSGDGAYVAFIRTNEFLVQEYPVQYFLSRPSGKQPPPGLENYPEVRQIKYPKAGSPNPIVNLQFFDVEKNEVFNIDLPDDFADNDRIINEVVWVSEGKLLLRETNRESDIVRIFLVDAKARTGKLVREDNIAGLDGGWVEPSQPTRFVPADPSKGRHHDGYIDTIIHEGYDHLAYFAPLDNPKPTMLTQGEWEVVEAPSGVDLEKGLVYFVATKEGPTQRHVYRVTLDGSDLRPVTNTSNPGYYGISFSHGTGYALVSYTGPMVPWQALINTQGDEIEFGDFIEVNSHLGDLAKSSALPTKIYSNVTIDGFTLQVVERRPANFDPAKQYPVLFFLYGGPGSQTVDQKFTVDFQSYVASSLEYIVVTVDGRGTGYIGRKARCIVRGNLGYYEALDQIKTAQIWATKNYVDESRIAVWGWSYGGFMTLKVLEQDAGETFQYGMAVAPVTDWRYYDSIYTERYMHTPEHNTIGYDNSTINDAEALGQSVRFLIMHGVADDNVHLQNTLVLLDKLDLSNIENYDMHVFPDSDHSIYFHNGHTVVYERLASWLVNAFNGEWKRIANPTPEEQSANASVNGSLPLSFSAQ